MLFQSKATLHLLLRKARVQRASVDRFTFRSRFWYQFIAQLAVAFVGERAGFLLSEVNLPRLRGLLDTNSSFALAKIIPPTWPPLNILNKMEAVNNHSFAFSLRFGSVGFKQSIGNPTPAKPGVGVSSAQPKASRAYIPERRPRVP
jgi:hypothetical protein